METSPGNDAMTSTPTTEESRTWTIAGMTCDHCALSVAEEVGKVPGASQVDVDLASGRLTVRGEGVDDADVRAAVAEAGYEVSP